MTPFYADDWLTVYGGDCREVLATLPADSVDCVVTSPPYWGLRDYGTATWEGGEVGCDHRNTNWPRGKDLGNSQGDRNNRTTPMRESCTKCGATRQDSQLGLERTPEEYVANMVNVFREVRRVLKPSGTCWLNLGDSYNSSSQNNHGKGGTKEQPGLTPEEWAGHRPNVPGLKPKDLVGIPWRVAFALQADGWYLRSDIIWAKPNPMPESVTDRPTKSHEYLFLLTKSARYYFDADAVRENFADERMGNPGRYRWTYGQATGKGSGDTSLLKADGMVEGWTKGAEQGGRNIRSVWNIATRPYPGAHFAVFPPELPERCIKAGSSEKGVCPECGVPWERVVERAAVEGRRDPGGVIGMADAGMYKGRAGSTTFSTTGWRPSCAHIAEPDHAVVLDPFAGSGTVGLVANRLSRRAILIDLNPEYLKQQMARNAQTPLGLGAA
jgi:DNA modification methylase